MKIGLVHNLYGDFSRGGAENVVKRQAEELRQQGNTVFLITTKPISAGELPPAIKTNDFKIYYLDSNFYNLGTKSWIYRFFWQITNIFSIRKYFQIKTILVAEKPDSVITHNLMGIGLLAPVVLRHLKIYHEHFLHDIQLLHPSGLMIWGGEKKIRSYGARVYQALTRFLLASPAKIISPSRWLLELHQKNGFFRNSRSELKPLQLPVGTTITRLKDQTKTTKNFLFVGQVEAHKGILFLIETFKKISDSTLKLQIVGDGQKMLAAKELAGEDQRIEFKGRLTSAAIKDIMNTSDCLIVPSLCYENSPTVIYEAQAAHLPVIAARIGGIPEIMKPGDRLFEPGNETDLKLNLIKKAAG